MCPLILSIVEWKRNNLWNAQTLDGMVPCFLLSVILDKLFYISELHFSCVQVNDLIVSLHYIFKDKNDVCTMPVWFVVVS